MKKKYLGAFIAAAFAAPGAVFAQGANVQIYGTLNVDVERVWADGGNVDDIDGRNRVSSNSSNIGFRGEEALANGLTAWFQIESSLSLDSGSGTWAGRNTAVGLHGAYGDVLLGQWDTPYKRAGAQLDPFGSTTIAAYTGIIGGDLTGSLSNNEGRQSFDRRQRNSVHYWSPVLSGFSAQVAYGADEERNAATDIDPALYSAAINWTDGRFNVGYAWERHTDYGVDGNRDTGQKIYGGFKFGTTTIGAIGERLKYDGPGGGLTYKGFNAGNDELQVSSLFLSLQHEIGPHVFRLAYGKNFDVELDGDDASDLEATQYSLGYGYNFSKRTELYALYTKIDNKDESNNTFGINPFAVAAGQNPEGLALGVKHRF